MKISKPTQTLKEVEKELSEDLEVGLSEFKQRKEAETKRYKDATTSRFYLCVVFQTQEQLVEFSEKIQHTDDIFIDGMELAKKFGIELKSDVPDMPRLPKNSAYTEFV